MKNSIFKVNNETGDPKLEDVKIGTQVWMTKNLGVDYFRNGDSIPHAATAEEWEKAGQNEQPAWCYYDNVLENGENYGKLYNWNAVNDPRGLAPEGYHIPSDNEWKMLTNYLEGEDFSGKKMKSSSGWNDNGNGTNESGFSGLPGGDRGYGGPFLNVGDYGTWWSSTEYDADGAWGRSLSYHNGSVTSYKFTKTFGFSVRCLRD
ncbi:MAG: fibrobacter succinogenes major paralogous domain-containing protein [Cryomorphaceae bacterium]|nr:fibrobacter succinogenes major paralogous domain-containing protein [Cryomorphaceae bacterium]